MQLATSPDVNRTQETTRVQHALGDVAGNACQALSQGVAAEADAGELLQQLGEPGLGQARVAAGGGHRGRRRARGQVPGEPPHVKT